MTYAVAWPYLNDMKYKIIILVFLVLVLSVSQGICAPKVLVEEPVHSFETIPEGSRVKHVFVIKNTGDEVLKILGIRPP